MNWMAIAFCLFCDRLGSNTTTMILPSSELFQPNGYKITTNHVVDLIVLLPLGLKTGNLQ